MSLSTLKKIAMGLSLSLIMMTASACSNGLQKAPPSVIPISEVKELAPDEYLIKCPTELESSGVSKEDFNSMSGNEQIKILRDYPIESFLKDGYTPCATRHNALVDWYFARHLNNETKD